jgi:hypothetical protein
MEQATNGGGELGRMAAYEVHRSFADRNGISTTKKLYDETEAPQ